jgi:hypothetical protein
VKRRPTGALRRFNNAEFIISGILSVWYYSVSRTSEHCLYIFCCSSLPFDLILVERFVVNSICTQMFEIVKDLVISRLMQ